LKVEAALSGPLENLLGRLLHYGTLAASGLIALGLALGVARGAVGVGIATAGIALFILLPTLRVAAMLIFFLGRATTAIAPSPPWCCSSFH
jgi:hypothetical protein